MQKIDEAMLTDQGICPTCYNRTHGYCLTGDETEQTIYENERFKCILINRPRAEGHTVIVSQAHYKDMMEIPDELCREVFAFAKWVMKALKEEYGAESVYLCTMCDGPMNHFHVQLIPRYAYEQRGSRNFVKERKPYLHDPERVARLRRKLEKV